LKWSKDRENLERRRKSEDRARKRERVSCEGDERKR